VLFHLEEETGLERSLAFLKRKREETSLTFLAEEHQRKNQKE